jgi:hypothetical protein
VARLVLKSLAEKYGGGVVEEPQTVLTAGAAPLPPPPPPPAVESTKPLEVEELSAGELLEEIDEFPIDSTFSSAHAPSPNHLPHRSVVEVPIVLDRSLFSGEGPVEIKLKLYIK